MNTLMARLALEWVAAERSAAAREVFSIANDANALGRTEDADKITAEAAKQPPPDAEELAIASDHVHRVLAGEVRWSEATPGDKAIWKLRFRDVEKYLRWQRRDENIEQDPAYEPMPPIPSPEPEDFAGRQQRMELARRLSSTASVPRTANVLAGTPAPPPLMQSPVQDPRARRAPRLEGYRERLWWNYYDTMTFEPGMDHGYKILFGTENVGNFWRSNMYQPGQFPGDQTFVIFGYWVSISDMSALAWFADNVQAEVIIGARSASPQTFGRDLFMGVPLLPPYGRPYIVPVRQSIGVRVNWKDKPPGLTCDMTFHLDGLGTRDVQ